jgi:branched-chain amino acid transport system ATP-binding protein
MNDPVLVMDDLEVSFGGVRAVDSVSLAVAPERLVGLIGPNGAGKTTLIDAVSGFHRDRATGTVRLGGHDVTDAPPHRRAHLGLARTWQGVDLFDDITVRENLAVAAHRLSFAGAIRDLLISQDDDPRVDRTLERLRLEPVADALPRDLSAGVRKLAGVARALVQEPAIVLLDEPAAGLDRRETAWLGEQLAGLTRNGMAVLLVDHDMSLVLDVCTEVHVLEFGRLIASGTPGEVRADERVIAAYLGSGAVA